MAGITPQPVSVFNIVEDGSAPRVETLSRPGPVKAGEAALLANAQGLAGLGRASEAVELLTAGADAPGASADLVYELGGLLERLGDFEGAARRYTHAVALDQLMEAAHAALAASQSNP